MRLSMEFAPPFCPAVGTQVRATGCLGIGFYWIFDGAMPAYCLRGHQMRPGVVVRTR